MEVAIIGLPQSGKTTVFNALTRRGADATGAAEVRVGVVKVADPRLDVLARMYQRKKTVYAEIKYWDISGPESLAKPQGIGGKNRNVLQGADAFLLVVRAFTNAAVPHPLDSLDPGRDLVNLLGELAFADLEVLERAVVRLEDGIKKSKVAERPAMAAHLETVKKVRASFEEGVPLRRQQLAGSELSILANYQFLTGKPVIVAFNADESGPEISLDRLGLSEKETAGLGQVSLCSRLEEDLAAMSGDEAEEFRRELGLDEPAVDRVIGVSFQTLGLISFLTVGDDEVRAWSVPAGMPAQLAAGTIHTDFQRGFIRAEVIPFDDLARCGSIAQGRKEGVLRSEGKTYGVKDGDVINFLINV